MSGGMGRPWSSGTLADGSASSRDDRAALSPHCWVHASPGSVERHAGLLLEWRREDRRWLGLVAYVPSEDRDRVRLIQRWVPAELLEPVDRG